MCIKLKDCKEVKLSDYYTLNNPVLKAETILDKNNEFWMVYESENNFYKVKNKKQFNTY